MDAISKARAVVESVQVPNPAAPADVVREIRASLWARDDDRFSYRRRASNTA